MLPIFFIPLKSFIILNNDANIPDDTNVFNKATNVVASALAKVLPKPSRNEINPFPNPDNIFFTILNKFLATFNNVSKNFDCSIASFIFLTYVLIPLHNFSKASLNLLVPVVALSIVLVFPLRSEKNLPILDKTLSGIVAISERALANIFTEGQIKLNKVFIAFVTHFIGVNIATNIFLILSPFSEITLNNFSVIL